METYKQEYNKLLEREQKAVKWLDDPKRTEAEQRKYIDDYTDILMNINRYIVKYKIPQENISGGFKND